MFLINTAMEKIPIGTAALIVVLGMAVVFFGLILLMFVTAIVADRTGKPLNQLRFISIREVKD